MPKGPHEARLDTYVTGGNVANIRHSAQVWDKGQKVLEDLAMALESAKPHLLNRFGPKTGPAAVEAFAKVAHNVRSQAAEMEKAVTALKSAGDALEDAQSTHHHLGNAPASPPSDPAQKAGESAEDFHGRQRQANAAQSHYASVFADRESKAQQATKDVDTKYQHAISVMEKIHGQPRTTTGGGSAGGGGSVPGGSLPSGPTAPPGGGQHTTLTGGHVTDGGHTGGPDTDGTDTGGPDTDGTDTGGTDTGGTDTGGTDAPPTYGDPGSSQGPGYPGYPGGPGSPSYPGGTVSPGGTTPSGFPGAPAGPSATSTAVGGVLSGGILGGTSSLSSAMRTTALSQSALSAEEQALLASRATGSTGATGATGAVTGRGGAVGMTGSGRGGAGGVGAGGRGDRGRKKKKATGVDFFEDNDDWVDDDEAAPGVLD